MEHIGRWTRVVQALGVLVSSATLFMGADGSCGGGGGGGGGGQPPDPGHDPGYSPAFSSTEVAPGVTAYDVVRYFAPVWYQDVDFGPNGVDGKADVITNVDYDTELRHNNNWNNLGTYQVYSYLYGALVATDTHYFLSFSHYHPRDWEYICTGLFTECHEGDMESIRIIVKRDTTGYGKVILVATGAHGEKYFWSNPGDGVSKKKEDLNGKIDYESDSGSIADAFDATHAHTRIYSQERGHGPIACRANENEPLFGWFGFFEGVRCQGKSGEKGFHQGNGIIYKHYEQTPEPYSKEQAQQNLVVNYAMIDYFIDLWPHRFNMGSGELFRTSDSLLYQGARGAPFLFAKPIGVKYDGAQFINDSTGGNAAWGGDLGGGKPGDAFFDPAYEFTQLFNFDHPVSMSYTYNPYIYPN
ncbi:MAG: hypothetical protein HYY13_01175 [Nitrospirae bacterium]|nr:hypothetical protein [Nitrospirota bacterium]